MQWIAPSEKDNATNTLENGSGRQRISAPGHRRRSGRRLAAGLFEGTFPNEVLGGLRARLRELSGRGEEREHGERLSSRGSSIALSSLPSLLPERTLLLRFQHQRCGYEVVGLAPLAPARRPLSRTRTPFGRPRGRAYVRATNTL